MFGSVLLEYVQPWKCFIRVRATHASPDNRRSNKYVDEGDET